MLPGSNGVEGDGALSCGEVMAGGNREVHMAPEGQAATESMRKTGNAAIGRPPIGPGTADSACGERSRSGRRAPIPMRNGVAAHSPSADTGAGYRAVALNDLIAHAIVTQVPS